MYSHVLLELIFCCVQMQDASCSCACKSLYPSFLIYTVKMSCIMKCCIFSRCVSTGWKPFFSQAAIQSTNDRVQYNDLQSLLCATLQVSVKHLMYRTFLFEQNEKERVCIIWDADLDIDFLLNVCTISSNDVKYFINEIWDPLYFQSVVRKMTPEDAPKISDQIMTALLSMFQNTSGKSGNVQEDALVAVSTLCEGGCCLVSCNCCMLTCTLSGHTN